MGEERGNISVLKGVGYYHPPGYYETPSFKELRVLLAMNYAY